LRVRFLRAACPTCWLLRVSQATDRVKRGVPAQRARALGAAVLKKALAARSRRVVRRSLQRAGIMCSETYKFSAGAALPLGRSWAGAAPPRQEPARARCRSSNHRAAAVRLPGQQPPEPSRSRERLLLGGGAVPAIRAGGCRENALRYSFQARERAYRRQEAPAHVGLALGTRLARTSLFSSFPRCILWQSLFLNLKSVKLQKQIWLTS
jgi:hypothetical protein